MATENLSPALRAPARSHPYPKAKPGYGKRSAPSRVPATGAEFALLPERERYVAGFVDHLPDGSAMDIKTLAKQLPLYGQQAVSSALTALSVAGHLRRVRRPAGEGDQVRWAFRTFWSRTARDNEWWNAFLAEEDAGTSPSTTTSETGPPPWATAEEPAPAAHVPPQAQAPEPDPERESEEENVRRPEQQEAQTPEASTPPAPAPPPQAPAATPPTTPAALPQSPRAALSLAYVALAQLGRHEPRLALSSADCETLQSLAQGWFDRGVDADYLFQALTCGIPARVDSPAGFVRDRLIRKLPPHLPPTPPAPGVTAHRLLVECTECGAPGRPESLPDGLCGPCRRSGPGAATPAPASTTSRPDARLLAEQIRGLLKTV
ncbi:MarR family transcriptional regulator [Streptomyces sp. NPDC017520]|uniref:MarR family transcriptional regulator n=1 Tax=Streptomyces sp. NPDC017520 TaxID=3364998 RepID=UPI00379E82DC